MKTKFTFLFILFVLPCFLVGQIPMDGLVAHYPLRENGNDASGNGHHLTNVNVTFIPGAVHNPDALYASFSGTNSYMYYNKSQFNDSFNLQNFTISAWSRLNSIKNLYANIFEIGESNFLRYYLPGLGGMRIQSGYRNGSGSKWITEDMFSAGFGFFNEWHHYVITSEVVSNGRFVSLFVDGNLELFSYNGLNYITLYQPADSLVHIGGRPETNLLNLDGGLLDVCYYNRILEEWEIQQLYDYTLEGPSSISDPLLTQEIKLWPNPAKGELYHNLEQGAPWKIYDVFGREVSRGISSGNAIDTSIIPGGMYFLVGERMGFGRFVRE